MYNESGGLRGHIHKVHAQGAMQRRNWNPDHGSAHYRLYTKWQGIASNPPLRENFCHYWRVVFLWAPLALMRHAVAEAYRRYVWLEVLTYAVVVLASMAGLAALTTLFTGVMGTVLIMAFGYAYVFIGGRAMLELASEVTRPGFLGIDERVWPWLDRQEMGIKCLFALVFSPVAIALFTIFLPLLSFGGLVTWLFEDKHIHRPIGRALVAHPNHRFFGWLGSWLVIPAGLAAAAVFSVPMRYVDAVLLGIVCFAAILLGIMWMTDVIRRHRDVRRVERPAAIRRFDDVDGVAVLRSETPKKRGVFRSVGDFFHLGWTAILVWKWKTCPWVTIESPQQVVSLDKLEPMTDD
jgi:hypothetical protein